MLVGVMAVTILPNGDRILEKEEFSNVLDSQIQTYMENDLQITRYKLLDEKIIVYYNITYIEQTHVNDTYRLFTQEKPFIISIDIWELCINKTTKQNCRNYLVDSITPYYLIQNESVVQDNITFYEITNTTIKSTWLQALEEQDKQYSRAIEFRNKTIENKLEELSNII